MPIRPVVDCTSCVAQKLAKRLSGLLKPWKKIIISHTHEFSEFASMLKDFGLESGEVALGFDVVSLYTNVLIKNCLHYLYSPLILDTP